MLDGWKLSTGETIPFVPTAAQVASEKTARDAKNTGGGRMATWLTREHSEVWITANVINRYPAGVNNFAVAQIMPGDLAQFFSYGQGDGTQNDGFGNPYRPTRVDTSIEQAMRQDPRTRLPIRTLILLPGHVRVRYPAQQLQALGITDPVLLACLTGTIDANTRQPAEINDVTGTLIPPQFAVGGPWRHDVIWEGLRNVCHMTYRQGNGGRNERKLGIGRFFSTGNLDTYVKAFGLADPGYDVPEGLLWDLETETEGRISFLLRSERAIHFPFQLVTGGVEGTGAEPIFPDQIAFSLRLVAIGPRLSSGEAFNAGS